MTSQERNRRRRTRRKFIALSLLGCMLLFLTGVLITYDTMQEVMGLRPKGSIFSFQSTGQALRDIAGEIPVDRFKAAGQSLLVHALRLLEKIRSMIFAAVSG